MKRSEILIKINHLIKAYDDPKCEDEYFVKHFKVEQASFKSFETVLDEFFCNNNINLSTE